MKTLTRSFLSTRAFLFPFIFAYLKPSSCKVFQSLYFDNFKEWFFSKVTRNQVVKMPVKASAEKRELILKIYKYFGAESKRKAPFYAWNKVIDRTVQALERKS
jgi:hypothetical protein